MAITTVLAVLIGQSAHNCLQEEVSMAATITAKEIFGDLVMDKSRLLLTASFGDPSLQDFKTFKEMFTRQIQWFLNRLLLIIIQIFRNKDCPLRHPLLRHIVCYLLGEILTVHLHQHPTTLQIPLIPLLIPRLLERTCMTSQSISSKQKHRDHGPIRILNLSALSLCPVAPCLLFTPVAINDRLIIAFPKTAVLPNWLASAHPFMIHRQCLVESHAFSHGWQWG